MRKLSLVSVLTMAAAVPAFGYTIVPGAVQSIPTTYNTRLGRPAVSNYRVMASGLASGGLQAQLFTLKSNTVSPIGLATAGNFSVSPLGFQQNDKIGIAGDWVIGDGGPDTQSATNFGWVLDGTNTYRYGDVGSSDQNFYDVDANGKAIYLRWNIAGNPGVYELMYQDFGTNPGGSPVAVLSSASNAAIGSSLCANIADDGSGKITWSGTGGALNTHYIFDLNTMTNHLVYTGPVGANVIRSRISDDGNWIVWNERAAGEALKRSDIMLQNVSNPASPGVAINLTNNATIIREDPNIEIVDANTAIIVWGESGLPENTANSYYIRAAVVEGLLSTPVITQELTIASEVGVATLRFPDVDENMITWARNPEGTGAITQYVLIPEPATMALLGLGVLALARRR